MSRTQKIITVSLWTILLLALGGVVAGRFILPGILGSSHPPEVLFPAANYSLVDQNNQPFSQANLAGKPYVAAFIFTQCASICPRMTSQMATLQKQLPQEVQLVSFSVDPTRDTPAVLKSYAASYNADESRWHFLTGDPAKIEAAVREMKLPFKAAEGETPILHSERLLLIDGQNQIRGTYHSSSPEDLKHLLEDAKYLAAHPTEKGSA